MVKKLNVMIIKTVATAIAVGYVRGSNPGLDIIWSINTERVSKEPSLASIHDAPNSPREMAAQNNEATIRGGRI